MNNPNPTPYLDAMEASLRLLLTQVAQMRVILDRPTSSGLTPLPRISDQPDPAWIPVLHAHAREERPYDFPCGHPALYLTERPAQHRQASLEVMRIRLPGATTWTIPRRTDEPRCSSCTQRIDPFSSADLDYLSIMEPSVISTSSSTESLQDSLRESPLTPGANHEMLDLLTSLSNDLRIPTDTDEPRV